MSSGVKSKPTTRRYTEEQKAQAVRLVFKLREELGTPHGTVQRVADQLGYATTTYDCGGNPDTYTNTLTPITEHHEQAFITTHQAELDTFLTEHRP